MFIQYKLAVLGYGDDEKKTTVIELTYNYGVTEYDKGNAYAQVREPFNKFAWRMSDLAKG